MTESARPWLTRGPGNPPPWVANEFQLRGSNVLDPAELARAYVVLKVYGERAHFKRSRSAALPAIE